MVKKDNSVEQIDTKTRPQIIPQRIIQTERPKFVIPNEKGPDFEMLQQRMFEF